MPFVHGMCGTPEIQAWNNMKKRCYNKNQRNYKNYGGRGITVCKEWQRDFRAFYDHIGPRPSPFHSLDRIDNNGNYEPGNVRWATSKEQRNNMRTKLNFSRSKIKAIIKSKQTCLFLAKKYGVSEITISRIKRGETIHNRRLTD